MNDSVEQPDLERLGSAVPRHVAIIMDGNGRWAEQRKKMRFSGHKAGVDSLRQVVRCCSDKGIKALTVFAFSSENWRRPKEEVGLLMDLFLISLRREIKRLHKNKVRMNFIGDISAFPKKLQKEIAAAQELTIENSGLTFTIAVNYGGRWDITEAMRGVAREVAEGNLAPDAITSEHIERYLSLRELPEPDLFIRTGGEMRISNFMLWQLAYSELYFTDTLWPDFKTEAFASALESFANRQRRFGMTGNQVEQIKGA
ncbi:di-trans,poly-cis-decaprenylcistransferase [Solemya pervernicosa gill symbiont]|uniref:Ditrans,polycis-undecaprenyl-diphosphate synthase ((2E,6E)-farnesyl-diphosphate specific) n=2 Tax=Gammaproteobacteria incertae sedis TaxID=118884 RepID=A0A1T2L826_9GAMM|nr:isoprenyl transferase [Candidatus Reidiella endopervernicosa]OOZ41184.1 di-trans,poly-cis-decaprenylcistransferase [Solemya pervernicosa gill symbiont]QKQ27091.1 isoprenyl transferase [Candidatus Reidiella endopervernicosa]